MRVDRAPRFLALAVLSLAAISAPAQDVTGRAILSEQRTDNGFFSSDVFRQTYELGLQRSISGPLRFRLFGRGDKNDGTVDFGTGTGRQSAHFWQVQPVGEVFYFLPNLQLDAHYDSLLSAGRTDGLPERRRRLDRMTGHLGFRPDGLPGMSLYAERRVTHDDATAFDLKDSFLVASLEKSFGGLHLEASRRYQSLDDGQLQFARRLVQDYGQVSYEDVLLGGRASVNANALVSYAKLDERARLTDVSVATPQTISRALYAIDETPLDARDHPPAVLRALNDGNLSQPTSVPVGSDGASYQDLVADMGRFVALDSFRIPVRDASAGPLPSGGGSLFWNVYRSQDGLDWTPISGGATTRFDPVQSLYEVTFERTTSRWFKLINFGLAPTPAFVTELQAVDHTTFSAKEVRRTNVLQTSFTASVSLRPVDRVTVDYYGLFNSTRQTSSGRPDLTTRDSDHMVSTGIDLTRRLNLLLRYERRNATASGGFDQSFETELADLRYRLLRNLDVTLEGIRAKEDSQGRPSEVRGGTLRGYFRFLRTLDLATSVGYQRQEFTLDGSAVGTTSASAVSIAEFTPALRGTFTASYQRSSPDGPLFGAASGVPTKDERYSGELFYRPGQQLGLGVRFGYVRSDAISGPIQQYRIDWIPFPYGALVLAARYDEDVDPFGRRHARRFMFTPRWTLNRKMFLDFNYTLQTFTGTPRTMQLYLTFTVTM